MSKVGRVEPGSINAFTPIHVRQQAFLVGPSHAFVRDPNVRGRWILVPRAVIEKSCPWCHAGIYQPCRNPRSGATWTTTHIGRRVSHFEANQRRRKVKR